MMILYGAEVDLFVPSFPELQRVFGLNAFMVELTLGVNLVAHALTALIVGNLGDRYGRKPVIILGLVIFIIGSIFCAYANNYPTILLGRLLQGVGIAGPSVLTYVIISDIYSTKKLQHLMGTMNATVTIAMATSPVIGSYINLFFNWRGNFFALLILGILTLILTICFTPNTSVKHDIKFSLAEYMPVLTSRKAMLYLIFLCFAMQSYWIFISMSPLLYMKELGVTLEFFGLYQGIIAAVFAAGSLSSGYFINRFGQLKCFTIASYVIGIFFIMTLLLAVFKVQNPLLITISMLFQAIGMVYPINILWPLAINSIPTAKSRVSAILVSGRLVLSAVSVQIVSYFYDKTYFMIGIAICITLIVSLIAFLKLNKEDQLFSS